MDDLFHVLALRMSHLAMDDLCKALDMLLYEWLLIVNSTPARPSNPTFHSHDAMLSNARSPQTMAQQDTDNEAWYEKKGGAWDSGTGSE